MIEAVIWRNTEEVDRRLLTGDANVQQAVGDNGWFQNPFTGIEARVGRPGKLASA